MEDPELQDHGSELENTQLIVANGENNDGDIITGPTLKLMFI